jgi:UDPglucose 6-dehydrogenase
MRVAVLGMWHLGTVTAACLAAVGHSVVGFDESPETIDHLRKAILPVAEPGLKDLVVTELAAARLTFSSSPKDLRDAEVIWVAYDTPVDDDDRADVDSVVDRLRALFPYFGSDATVIVSSQMPVGSTRRLEDLFKKARPDATVRFAYSPENLRLGKAIDVFLRPDRVVVGVRDSATRERVAEALAPVTNEIQWMSVESAEMTKHALNAFLATSITFINEIAGLCERVGADAGDVGKALKSDVRIGPRAYLQPGTAFAGGTLARDLSFLAEIGAKVQRPTHLLSSVITSNAAHRSWPLLRLRELLPDLPTQRVAVLGLTYKPGTDTLRRSTAVELCRELRGLGASVVAYDPALRELPADVATFVDLRRSPEDALRGATATLVGTSCREFLAIRADDVVSWMKNPLVLDPGGFLEASLGKDDRIRYAKVGRAHETAG